MPYKDPIKKSAWRKRQIETGRKQRRCPRYCFYILRGGARVRKISCNLTLKDYLAMVEGRKCFYCEGTLPEQGGGLDRKDSSGEYSVENCVPCCTACNTIRGKDLISHSEMIEVANLLKKLRNKS